MNEQQALQLVAEANPVPDAEAFASETLRQRRLEPFAFLAATQEMSEMTQTKEPQRVETPQPRRPRWLPLVAAAAAVLVVATALLSLTARTDGEPAGPPTTEAPTQTTEALTQTTTATDVPGDTGDIEAAIAGVNAHVASFVADVNDGRSGAEIVAASFPPVEQSSCGGDTGRSCEGLVLQGAPTTFEFLDEWFDHLVAIETTYEMGECRAIGDDGTVGCELRSTSPHEPFYPDFRTEEYKLRFEGGDIVHASLDETGIAWRLQEALFEQWLREAHPDVASDMYTLAGAGGFPQPKITSGSQEFSQNLITYVALWRESSEG